LKIQSRVEWMNGEPGVPAHAHVRARAHTHTHAHTEHHDLKNLLVKGEYQLHLLGLILLSQHTTPQSKIDMIPLKKWSLCCRHLPPSNNPLHPPGGRLFGTLSQPRQCDKVNNLLLCPETKPDSLVMCPLA
jgi:hypothetical protein